MIKHLLAATFFLLSCLVILIFFSLPDKNLRLIVCDVGQGDVILIQQAFLQVLVDGGPDNRVLSCLGRYMPFWDKHIDLVILTHPQADHMTGLTEVFRRYKIETFMASAISNETYVFKQLHQAVREESSLVILPKQGDKLKIGELKLTFLWPEEKIGSDSFWNRDKEAGHTMSKNINQPIDDLNDISTVFKLEFDNFQALLPGDIGFPQEKALIRSGLLTEINVLKMPHHGSKHSSSTGFIQRLDPSLAISSSGKNNRHGHPAPEVLARYKNLGVSVMRTDIDGDVIVVTDGKKFWTE